MTMHRLLKNEDSVALHDDPDVSFTNVSKKNQDVEIVSGCFLA